MKQRQLDELKNIQLKRPKLILWLKTKLNALSQIQIWFNIHIVKCFCS